MVADEHLISTRGAMAPLVVVNHAGRRPRIKEERMSIILGIDPGSRITGYGVIHPWRDAVNTWARGAFEPVVMFWRPSSSKFMMVSAR